MTAITQGDGAGFSYLRSGGGKGIPIVLLHGIGSNAQSFEPLMRALPHPAIAWNAPGYGESDPLTQEWPDASDYAAALQRLLAHLQVKQCVLLGHSLGALIAARYAVRQPIEFEIADAISGFLGGATVAARQHLDPGQQFGK